ncbi:MAG: hypothetical protein ABR517_09830, partial [Thermoanaerobaculia bacterium]
RWWSLRGEIKERGGGDAVASLTTSDAEIARNLDQPFGLRAGQHHLDAATSSTMNHIASSAAAPI